MGKPLQEYCFNLALPSAKQLRRNVDFSSICGVFSFNLWGFPLTARGLVPVAIFLLLLSHYKAIKNGNQTLLSAIVIRTCGRLHYYKYLLIMQVPPLLGRAFCHTMKLFWLLIIVIGKSEIFFGKAIQSL